MRFENLTIFTGYLSIIVQESKQDEFGDSPLINFIMIDYN